MNTSPHHASSLPVSCFPPVTDHGEKLAEHGARLSNVEERQRNTEKKLDRLLFLMITTLIGVAGELALLVFKH